MDSLKECIDYHNHFTTMSHKESCMLKYKNSFKENIELDKCISLKSFLYSFGKMYKSFKCDYKTLPKFDLGESFEVWDYSNANEEEATIYIINPVISNTDSCYLNIVRDNKNNINCYVSTDDHEYYFRNNKINLDNNFCISYLNFIEKYYHFIECYSLSKGNVMFSNRECSIISDYIGNIYNSLDYLILKINMVFHMNDYKIIIVFDLNTLNIDYEKSSIEGINADKITVLNTLVSDLYISKDRIVSIYYDDDEVKKLRLKKGLDI